MPSTQFSQVFCKSVLQEFGYLSAPLFAAAGNPVALYRLLHQMGWDFDTVFGVDTTRLLQDFRLAEQTAKAVLLALDHEDDAEIVQDAHDRFKTFIERLEGLYPTLMDIDPAATLDSIDLEHAAEFGKDLANFLLLRYLHHRAPGAFHFAKLFGLILIRPAATLYPGNDDARKPIRYPLERPVLNWRGLLSPHTNPFAALLSQIDFSVITSLESLLAEAQRLFQKFLRELYQTIGRNGLNGMTVRLDAGGLSLLGGNWLPFPEAADPPLVIQLSDPGSPQLSVDPEAWRFSWLPDIAQPDGAVVIFDQDWMKITLLPATGADGLSAGPGLSLYENGDGAPTFEIVGGLGIMFPLDMLTDETGNAVGAGARGRLVLTEGSTPQLTIDEMSISGSFRFGGPDGLAIEDAQLAIQNIVLPQMTPGIFPFAISLAGTLVLPNTAGHFIVALNFDRERVLFRSTGEIHLGNGIWLHPIAADRPVLEMSGSTVGAYSFGIAALFKIPREGDGVTDVEVSGSLELERNAAGSWQVKSFSAAAAADHLEWELPGKIVLTNAGVWLSYDKAVMAFKAGISGGFALRETDAAIAVALEFEFPDPADPANIRIQSNLDIEQLLILDQVYFFNLEMELHVRTKPNGSMLAPTGYLSISDAMTGMFPKETITGAPAPEQFHLVIQNVQSVLHFQSTGFAFDLTAGQLLLPAIFYADISGVPGRAGINVGDHSLLLVFEQGIGLRFEGSLIAAQIGVVTDQFNTQPKPGIYLESAQLFLPAIEIPTSGPASVSLPQLAEASGQVVIPVSEAETLNFGFADLTWDLAGLPQGVIYLAGDTDIQLGGGFVLSFLGTLPHRTELSIYEADTGLKIEISAAVRLTMPASMLTGVNGDTIALEAGGALRLQPELEKVEIADLHLAFIGNFHLGGENGFYIEDGRIEARSVENILAPTASDPFEIALSGMLTLPNGPKGGLENARFVFTGDPLPHFDLDGIMGGTGNMDLAGEYLPLNVKELRLHFDPSLDLPEKLYPLNTTVNIDAELNIGDTLSGAVEDLVITFDADGRPHFSVDSLLLMVNGLEMGSFVLGGGLGIGGLNDIPDSLVVAGNLKGNFNGTTIEALAAFGIVDGLPAPLGAALGAQMGPGGIPLWASGFLLTGAKGGISFTGGNADPDDLKNYIIIDESTGAINSQPRPAPEEAADVQPEQQSDTSRAPRAPHDAGLTFQCPDEPCPPPSVGILYEPHPDEENYPHRIIIKFTSLQKSVVDDLLDQAGLSSGQLQAMTPAALASRLSDGIVHIFTTTLPFPAAQIETLIRQPMKELFQAAAEKALAGSDSVYEAILREAYKGIRAPNVTVKLTGIISYTGISSFLAIEGGVVISPTVQSAGIVGNVLLLGIPVGRLRAFLTLNNELGLPDPALCGDLAFSLGPLDLGYLRFTCKYGVDFTNLANTLINLIGNLGSDLLDNALDRVNAELHNAHARNPATTLQNMSTEQQLAFVAQILQQPFTPEAREFLLGLFDAGWDNYHPQMLLCGSAQPKLFGLALDGELVGVSAMADKTSFAANFRFSPTGLLSKVFYNILPAVDQMSCSVRMELPDPRPLIAAGLSANFGTDGIAGFLQDGLLHVINHTQATIDYEIAPLGLKLANAEARILFPYLQDHPAHPDSRWKRPEDRPNRYPSRMEVLIAALDDDQLGNIFWKGANAELKALTALSGVPLGNLTLQRDYFPHGGILGAGRLMLPKILLEALPTTLFNQLFTGSVFQKVQVALQLINEYLLTTRSVGQLAFYIPAPNPPAGALEQAQDLQQLLEQVRHQDFDLDGFETPELYPKSELFLKGFLGTANDPLTILGVPVGSASIELVPPDGGAEGYFKIESTIPANSWLKDFVDNALLQFTIRKKPSEPIEKRFEALRLQLQTARNKTTVINRLISDLQQEMPKVALLAEINNLKIPAVLTPVLEAGAHLSASLYGYSPLYDYRGALGATDLVSKAKNEGGLVMVINGALHIARPFGISIQSARTEVGIFPEITGFPALSIQLSVRSVGMPMGLPAIKNADVLLQVEGGGPMPALPTGGLSITGAIQNNDIQLTLQKHGNDLQLEGDAQLTYKINGKVGPVYLPGTNVKLLDTLTIDSNANGLFYFRFHPVNGQINIKKLRFEWNGSNWTAPDLSLKIIDGRFNWPARIFQQIREHAYEIFAKILTDPEAWMENVRNGAFTLSNQSAANLADILRALGATLEQAARLLAEKFNDVSLLIKTLFDEFGGAMVNVLRALKSAGFNDAQAIANALFDLYQGAYVNDLVSLFKNYWGTWKDPIRSITSLLLNAGFGLEAVLGALKQAFGSNQLEAITDAARIYWGSSLTKMQEITLALKNLWGSSVANLNKIAGALKQAWGKSTTALNNMAKALKYAWGDDATHLNNIAKALKEAWGSSDTALNSIANALKGAWGSGYFKEIARALKLAWDGADELIVKIANVLKNYFTLSHAAVMEALKYCGFGSYEVAAVMKSVFDASATTVAEFLKNSWNKSSTDITRRLRDAGYAAKYVADALENLGYSAYTVALRLKEEFDDLTHTDAMGALKYAGYGASEVVREMFRVFNASILDVANFLKNEWNKGYGEILSLMTGAGYAYSAVAQVLGQLF